MSTQLGIRIDAPHEGDRWLLVLTDTDDATYALFEELELQGGGYTWEAITHALVELNAPGKLAEALDINAEGDEMYVYADGRPALDRLEQLLRAAAADHQLLRTAMDHAGEDLE